MAKNKTNQTEANVSDFVTKVENPTRRSDSFKLIDLLSALTGYEAKMWGPSIIGFGTYHYKYASGHEGDMPLAAFSPRKDALVLYFATDFKDREELLGLLGKHKSSKACVYVKKFEDIDREVFIQMTKNSINTVVKMFPENQ